MVIPNVGIKTFDCLSIKNLSIKATDEADVPDIIFYFTGLRSELSKCINDNTKDDVQKNCDNDQEECQIED